MIAGGALRDRQGLRNLTIGQPLRNQRRHFLFAGRKRMLSGTARYTTRESQGGSLLRLNRRCAIVRCDTSSLYNVPVQRPAQTGGARARSGRT